MFSSTLILFLTLANLAFCAPIPNSASTSATTITVPATVGEIIAGIIAPLASTHKHIPKPIQVLPTLSNILPPPVVKISPVKGKHIVLPITTLLPSVAKVQIVSPPIVRIDPEVVYPELDLSTIVKPSIVTIHGVTGLAVVL